MMTKEGKRRYPPIVEFDLPLPWVVGRVFKRFWRWLFDPAQFRGVDGRADDRQPEDEKRWRVSDTTHGSDGR